jgi:hypothetical protein
LSIVQLLHALGLRAQRLAWLPTRTGQHAHQHARRACMQALVMASDLVQPQRALVAEGDRQRLHAMRAPGHGHVAVR